MSDFGGPSDTSAFPLEASGSHLLSLSAIPQGEELEHPTDFSNNRVKTMSDVPSDQVSNTIQKLVAHKLSTYNYCIGPLELDISFNADTNGMDVKAYFIIPLVSKVEIASVSGSLKEGLGTKLGYGTYLSGQFTIRQIEKDVILSIEFVTFGTPFKSTAKIFSL